MKTTYFIIFLFVSVSFSSFASEIDSKNSIQKEITTNYLAKKTEITTTKKQKKLNFKERLALKLVEKKIKKIDKKQTKKIKFNPDGTAITILFSVLFILGGLIGGIIALALGETLLGILLLVGGLIFVPLILALILLFSIQGIC